jgi:predicted RNase H-like nuclease (RuvC/YqgF family)
MEFFSLGMGALPLILAILGLFFIGYTIYLIFKKERGASIASALAALVVFFLSIFWRQKKDPPRRKKPKLQGPTKEEVQETDKEVEQLKEESRSLRERVKETNEEIDRAIADSGDDIPDDDLGSDFRKRIEALRNKG